ncbi:MAG TPA: hypothetical protein VML54_00640 [Candidatus Limnocylindrales bacterium]|nr:hypothetical protein [Candidatus Limnocylindrales bacterium]
MRTAFAAAIVAAILATGPATVVAQSGPGARQAVTGEVTRVDVKDGWVHVKTADGTMIVHYPPAQLQSVKKGDMVTLHLALKDNGPAPKK